MNRHTVTVTVRWDWDPDQELWKQIGADRPEETRNAKD